MNVLKYMAVVAIAIALAGCGGGGGSSGSTSGSGSGSGTGSGGSGTGTGSGSGGTVTPTAADFVFELNKNSLTNSGTDVVVLSVTALDSSRNVVANVPVSVSVNNGAVFTPGSTVTDASGRYSGNITIGNSRDNRRIDATITVAGMTKLASVLVTGSQLAVMVVPSSPAPGSNVTVTVNTTNVDGKPVPNVPVKLSGVQGIASTITTDLNGTASTNFTAPSAGTYTLLAEGSGLKIQKTFQVVSPSGGAPIVPASTVISSASLSPQVTSIPPNAANSTANRAKLTAKFIDNNNQGIPNMRVRFEIVPPGLGSGEAISSGNSIILTDASGVAEADYIAGTRSSPTNGVQLRACYSKTDTIDCSSAVTTNLTVAGVALSITIGENNTLQKGAGGIAYIKQFLIQVSDSSGTAVRDAVISASVDLTHFGKGSFNGNYPTGRVPPNISNGNIPTANNTTPSSTSGRVWCLNEDRNRNGFLDTSPSPSEDVNGNGRLDPRQAEVVVSYVSSNKTDEKGQLLIQVNYPQNVATWLSYTIRATTNVAGSEGLAEKAYITDFLEEDAANGSFLTPPYGTGSCVNPN